MYVGVGLTHDSPTLFWYKSVCYMPRNKKSFFFFSFLFQFFVSYVLVMSTRPIEIF